MEFPKMLYRAPGTEDVHGMKLATLIVDDEEAQRAAIAEGWRLTTPETAEAPEPPKKRKG